MACNYCNRHSCKGRHLNTQGGCQGCLVSDELVDSVNQEVNEAHPTVQAEAENEVDSEPEVQGEEEEGDNNVQPDEGF